MTPSRVCRPHTRSSRSRGCRAARSRRSPSERIHACPFDDRLLVVDKLNGGKADAINAGLRFARYPLFCTMDADTIVDADAFARLVRPFQAHPETVACGGIVRIANGCSVRGGRVEDVRAPRGFLANVQVMEYLRAFLCGRTGWSRLGALLVISGAFGLFRRDIVVEAGGYDTTTVGEDAEIVVRLHRYCREHGRPYRVVFLADPVCWTEAPADFRSLCRQRNRWHRGLIETLWRHRSMFLRPRYGVVGLVALPYFLLFEALGPIVEIVGTVSVDPRARARPTRSARRAAVLRARPQLRPRALVRSAARGGARLPAVPSLAVPGAPRRRCGVRELRLSPVPLARPRLVDRDAGASQGPPQLGSDEPRRIRVRQAMSAPAAEAAGAARLQSFSA